jgi:hypothetical protein
MLENLYTFTAPGREKGMAILTQRLIESEKLFEKIAKELDISPSLYKLAVERYSAVGAWLDEIEIKEVFDDSNDPIPSGKITAEIYPQGSFAIGTVVKPWIGDDEKEYDIDLVFQLDIPVGSKQAKSLKTAVGNRLKSHKTYAPMLKDERKRCWTLIYAEQSNAKFHLDILPSLTGFRNKEIKITDKITPVHYQWLPSNPRGYAEWFKKRNELAQSRIATHDRQRIFSQDEAIYATVHDVPDQLIRTPLQRAIQILKRHRDVRFSGVPDEETKPISMIITTLSALIYNNEESISLTLENIIKTLKQYNALLTGSSYSLPRDSRLIQRGEDGIWVLPNPVCPEENFADKWHLDNNKRANAFFKWVNWLDNDLSEILNQHESQDKNRLISASFGKRIANSVIPLGDTSIATSLVIHNASYGDVSIDSPARPWRVNG